MIVWPHNYFDCQLISEKNIKEKAFSSDLAMYDCQGGVMSSNAIYCGFCQGQCPLGVEKTMDCRVIQGYECPYFCDPANREPIAS